MTLRLHFGVPPKKIREVKWYDDILKMPRVIKMGNSFYEWIMYDKTAVGDNADYILTYGESKDPTRWVGLEVVDYDQLFGWQFGDDTQCDCGAKYDRGFENFHSDWCKTQEFKK